MCRSPPHFERMSCRVWLRPALPPRKQEAAVPASAARPLAASHTESPERPPCPPAKFRATGRRPHGPSGRLRRHVLPELTNQMRSEAESKAAETKQKTNARTSSARDLRRKSNLGRDFAAALNAVLQRKVRVPAPSFAALVQSPSQRLDSPFGITQDNSLDH